MKRKVFYIILSIFIALNLSGCINEKNNNSKKKRITYGIVIISKNDESKTSIDENDLKISKDVLDKYYEHFNTIIFEKVKEDYPRLKKVEMESIKDTGLIKIIYSCDELSDEVCISILDKYFSYINSDIDVNGYEISILDSPAAVIEVE